VGVRFADLASARGDEMNAVDINPGFEGAGKVFACLILSAKQAPLSHGAAELAALEIVKAGRLVDIALEALRAIQAASRPGDASAESAVRMEALAYRAWVRMAEVNQKASLDPSRVEGVTPL